MAGVSSITGYSIYTAFSNYGGYAGQSSTTSGVGGVGAYHHHHRGRASAAQDNAGQKSPAFNRTSDLLDVLSATSGSGAGTAIPPSDGNGAGLLTGSSSTLAAWIAGAGSPGSPPDARGRFLDTLA